MKKDVLSAGHVETSSPHSASNGKPMSPFPLSPSSDKNPSLYWTQVGDWMREAGGVYLRSVDGVADADHLAHRILTMVAKHTPKGVLPGAGRYGMSWEELDDRAAEVADYLLETYRPVHRFTRAERVRGGRKSKRTSVLLRRFHSLPEGLTNEEVAERLDCHIRTVSRLRAALREELAQLMPADLREILEGTSKPARTMNRETFELLEETPDEEPQAAEQESISEPTTVDEEVRAIFEDLGVFRMADGSIHIQDPNPITLDQVLDGLDDEPAQPLWLRDPQAFRLQEEARRIAQHADAFDDLLVSL